MRIVLVGDIHVHHLLVWPWLLTGKRALGQANVWLSRRRRFKLPLLADFFLRVAEVEADLQLFSGDVTSTSLSREFRMVQALAGSAMSRRPTFMVPGNHDRYTLASSWTKRFERYFKPFTEDSWPAYRLLSPGLHLVGLDPTRPTTLNAIGKLGKKQLAALQLILEQKVPSGDRLVILCHYPVGAPPGHKPEVHSHTMLDAGRLVRILAAAGCETLYLHGHVHTPWCWRLQKAPNVVAVNAGAPVLVNRSFPSGQGFWEIETADQQRAMGLPSEASADGAKLVHHAPDSDGNWVSSPVAWPRKAGEVSPVSSPCEPDRAPKDGDPLAG